MQSLCTLRNHCRQWHATLATKRTLLLTWAGLPPAGSHQLCLAHSFNHLAGAAEQRRRDVEAECHGCSEVDHKLELRGAVDRHVGGLGTLEDAAGIDADPSICIGYAVAITHQAAGFGELAHGIDG